MINLFKHLLCKWGIIHLVWAYDYNGNRMLRVVHFDGTGDFVYGALAKEVGYLGNTGYCHGPRIGNLNRWEPYNGLTDQPFVSISWARKYPPPEFRPQPPPNNMGDWPLIPADPQGWAGQPAPADERW